MIAALEFHSIGVGLCHLLLRRSSGSHPACIINLGLLGRMQRFRPHFLFSFYTQCHGAISPDLVNTFREGSLDTRFISAAAVSQAASFPLFIPSSPASCYAPAELEHALTIYTSSRSQILPGLRALKTLSSKPLFSIVLLLLRTFHLHTDCFRLFGGSVLHRQCISGVHCC